MKNVSAKRLSLLLLLLSTAAVHNTDARMRFFFDDDPWGFDSNIFDDMREHMRQMSEHFASFGPSKEEKEAVKSARKTLSAIKPEVTQDDNNVYVKFAINTIDKKNVDIEFKEYARPKRGDIYKMYPYLKGVISTDNGKVEFYVTKDALEVSRHIEIKKQNKDDKKQAVAYYGSSAAEVVSLPASVEISQDTAKAAIKDATLTITLAKKQQAKTTKKPQAKLPISVA